MTYFYDSHCHVMNLRHPNISAVINRYLTEAGGWTRFVAGAAVMLTGFPGVQKFLLGLTNEDERIMSLLAIMETPLGDYLLQMEEDLRKRVWGKGVCIPNRVEPYEKVFLTPLLMDFALRGNEKKDSKLVYSVRWKPMADQVRDVCLGIADYYRHKAFKKENPMLEVHPFMGINPLIYNLDPEGDDDDRDTLKQVLDKYFFNFTGTEPSSVRRKRILAYNWQNFRGDLQTLGHDVFLGIKVYPPTGFNPWPMNNKEQTDMLPNAGWTKLKDFYSYCVEKNIPLTTHCSSGGFLTDPAYADFANPARWEQVLVAYPKLRLNLAHLGYDDGDNEVMTSLFNENSWRRVAADLACKYDNVYVDISYRGVKPRYYEELKKLFELLTDPARKRLEDKIIFGSDFMINLMSIDSYSKYMQNFMSSSLGGVLMDKFCNKNPESFLFI
jgi:Amidohydrolase